MPDSAIVKYLVKLRFEVDGVVEKADMIGAIFGQTEGLFGPEMNQRAPEELEGREDRDQPRVQER